MGKSRNLNRQPGLERSWIPNMPVPIERLVLRRIYAIKQD
jgi:hypothetical protein